VVETPTENVDLWPTLYDLLGLPRSDDVDGRSRVPEIRDAGAPPDGANSELTFAQIDRHWGQTRKQPRPLIAVGDGSYRLYYDSAEPDRLELYDLAADPREQENLAETEPERALRLKRHAIAYLEDATPPWGRAPKVEIDDMQLRQLRALGYKVD
jgi:arylsulfatase A-like enzyme